MCCIICIFLCDKVLFQNLFGCDPETGGFEPFRSETCESRPQFWTGILYFWTYSVITSMVLLSAFLGV